MFKKNLYKIVIILVLAISTSYTYAVAPPQLAEQLQSERQLQPIVQKIQQLPAVQDLIANATEEGPIKVKINRKMPKKFDGYWSASDRTIHLTKTDKTSEGTLLSTLIFELHNATRDTDFNHLDDLASRGRISKADYVEGVEYIEYENALSTSTILNEGISKGLLPRDAYWKVASNFDEHFLIQKKCGHSKWIANSYDELIK